MDTIHTETLTQDLARLHYLVGNAFDASGNMTNLAFKERDHPGKLRPYLTRAMSEFEKATLELRQICERYGLAADSASAIGAFRGRKAPVPARDVTGSVETVGCDWLHIRLNTLLPSARYQPSSYLTDTIRRLLDEYESGGKTLPRYERALMVIEERSEISGRRVFDQDNKGWKAVSNAIKGRLIPDDDQYTLGVALLSLKSGENACHVVLMNASDAGDFFTSHARGGLF